jgi:preprotein translocase subunit SecF
MRFFSQVPNFDFMGKRRIAMIASAIAMIVSIGSLAVRGLEFGVDFTGGVIMEVAYPETVDLAEVREALEAGGFGTVRAQHYGSTHDVLIRAMPSEEKDESRQAQDMLGALKVQDAGVELRRVEFVGPQVGSDLRVQGALAMVFALIGILIYVAVRFKWKFSVGAVAATVHDVILVIGWFSLLGLEFDLTVLAAVLAIIGYALNDTVVIFDRIRENFRKVRKASPEEIMNLSINQTLSRSIMTHLVTLIVVFAMFFVGGEVIHNFSIALIVGIIVATYASIYIASALTLWLKVTPADVIEAAPEQKERREIDALP